MASLTLELVTNSSDYTIRNSIELDLVNHVHKRIETFMYLDDVKSSAVALDYFESDEIDSKYNIFIADRSYSLPANSLKKLDIHSGMEKVIGKVVNATYKDLLITNKTFIDELNHERPLFFLHRLPSNVTDASLEIVQFGNSDIIDSGYVLDLAKQVIYTNYQNYFNQETGSYRLYFLTITCSDGSMRRELLNSELVVREATWEDIDLATGNIYTDRTVYSREKNTSGYTFYFNEYSTYWIKPQLKSLIRVRPPTGRASDDAWYTRITNGDITSITNNSVRRYWLPEYLTQPYQPSFPYVFSAYNKMLFVSDRVLSATRGSLAINPAEGRHLTLFFYDFEHNLIKIWTTNSGLSQTRYSNTNVFYESDKILCYDNHHGFIVTTESILPSWEITAEFFFEADDIELTSLNLNPVQNRSLLDQSVVLYLVPDADSSDRGLHYLLVESDGRISYCSQALGFSYPNLQLKNSDGSFNSETVIGLKYISDIDDDTFLSRYTVGYDNGFAYLILAEINVLNRSTLNKAKVYDVRAKGDCLAQLNEETYAKNPKALQSRYGYGENGATVPLNNVVVIQAPITILTDYGGALQKDRATELLKRYLVAGTYPIIDWTYPYSELTVDVTNQVSLTWTWEGIFTYKLYRRFNEAESWTLIYETSSTTPEVLNYIDTDVNSEDVVYYELRISDEYEYPAPYFVTVKVK